VDWNSGDRLWLLELITPFATPENKLAEIMFADLLNGPFKGKRFTLHRTDPTTGVKDRITLGG
jgi:cytolysin-activating lysine-acyltransferase